LASSQPYRENIPLKFCAAFSLPARPALHRAKISREYGKLESRTEFGPRAFRSFPAFQLSTFSSSIFGFLIS
jgi:hypothetical protein